MRRGAQHDAAMNGIPLVAPAAASLTRRGLMMPPADAAAARVPPPLRCGRRMATAWRPATHRAGAAAGADAASSTGATLRGATCGGRDRGGADLGWKLTAVGAGTGAARTAGAGAAAASTQSGWRPRAAVTGIGRRRCRRRKADPRPSFAVDGAVEARAGGGAPLAVGGGESGGVGKRGVAGCGVGKLEKGGGGGGSRARHLSSALVARWGPMVGSAAPPSRARRRVSEPLCHVLSLTSKRWAVGSPRVVFLAARCYFLLPSARALRRGDGGVSQGGRTTPGEGAGGDANARRGWRCGRSRRLRQSERIGRCGEPTGPGCAVFVRQSGAPGGDCLHRCFRTICLFYTFLLTIFLTWHAPRLFAALAPSLIGRAASCNLHVRPHREKLPSTSRSQPPTPRAPSSAMSSSPNGCYRQLSCNTLPLSRPTPHAPFPSRPTAAHCLCIAFPPALWTHPLYERFLTPSVRFMPHSPPANAPPPPPPRVPPLGRLLPPPPCPEHLLPHDWRSTVLPAE